MVCADADRLKQLLLILLDNALKYTPMGGKVRVVGKAEADSWSIIVSARVSVCPALMTSPFRFLPVIIV